MYIRANQVSILEAQLGRWCIFFFVNGEGNTTGMWMEKNAIKLDSLRKKKVAMEQLAVSYRALRSNQRNYNGSPFLPLFIPAEQSSNQKMSIQSLYWQFNEIRLGLFLKCRFPNSFHFILFQSQRPIRCVLWCYLIDCYQKNNWSPLTKKPKNSVFIVNGSTSSWSVRNKNQVTIDSCLNQQLVVTRHGFCVC